MQGFVESSPAGTGCLRPKLKGTQYVFFSKILFKLFKFFFGCNPSLITHKKMFFSQLETPRIHKSWTSLSLQLLLGLLASGSQVHPQWCFGRWDLAGKKLAERNLKRDIFCHFEGMKEYTCTGMVNLKDFLYKRCQAPKRKGSSPFGILFLQRRAVSFREGRWVIGDCGWDLWLNFVRSIPRFLWQMKV